MRSGSLRFNITAENWMKKIAMPLFEYLIKNKFRLSIPQIITIVKFHTLKLQKPTLKFIVFEISKTNLEKSSQRSVIVRFGTWAITLSFETISPRNRIVRSPRRLPGVENILPITPIHPHPVVSPLRRHVRGIFPHPGERARTCVISLPVALTRLALRKCRVA